MSDSIDIDALVERLERHTCACDFCADIHGAQAALRQLEAERADFMHSPCYEHGCSAIVLRNEKHEAEQDRNRLAAENAELRNAAEHLDAMMLRLAFDGGAVDAEGGEFGIDPWGTLTDFRQTFGLPPTMSADDYANCLGNVYPARTAAAPEADDGE